MKEITKIKERLEQRYCKKFCGVKDPESCPKTHCSCAMAAETKAYMDAVIPKPYSQMSLKDLNGKGENGELIMNDFLLKKIKKQLSNYCFRGVDINNLDQYSISDLNSKSIMHHRRENCDNLVIYSDEENTSSSYIGGKTFISSLVMKEAIKSRILNGNISESYDWIQYSALKQRLISDPDSLSDTKCCDWLVIDDITSESQSTRNQKSLISSKLDSFFYERAEDGLPIIFVFRFDVTINHSEIEDYYGLTMAKTVKNSQKISLTHNG
jgi:hypothetical protein